jgi:hypothetical protein
MKDGIMGKAFYFAHLFSSFHFLFPLCPGPSGSAFETALYHDGRNDYGIFGMMVQEKDD